MDKTKISGHSTVHFLFLFQTQIMFIQVIDYQNS